MEGGVKFPCCLTLFCCRCSVNAYITHKPRQRDKDSISLFYKRPVITTQGIYFIAYLNKSRQTALPFASFLLQHTRLYQDNPSFFGLSVEGIDPTKAIGWGLSTQARTIKNLDAVTTIRSLTGIGHAFLGKVYTGATNRFHPSLRSKHCSYGTWGQCVRRVSMLSSTLRGSQLTNNKPTQQQQPTR